MAVPKKRTSSTKRGMRQAHDRLLPVTLTKCSNCGELKRPHAVCKACGQYRGRKLTAAA